MNTKSILTLLKYIISISVAFGILYFLFKNQDPIKLIEEIKKVDSLNDFWWMCHHK